MYKSVAIEAWENTAQSFRDTLATSPAVVVGGTGGSGTRLVVQLLSDLGVQMGLGRNHAGDAIPFTTLYDRHINACLGGALQADVFLDNLRQAVVAHLGNAATNGPWGWKNPRSIYLLPVWDRLWPRLTYIHVVRDGMAMATSANQAQLAKHGIAVLGPACRHLSAAHQSMVMWATVNSAAADYGVAMGARYLRLRYEDICQSPGSVMETIAGALGLTGRHQCSVQIGTMRPRDAATSLPLDPLARQTTENALRRFGYSQ